MAQKLATQSYTDNGKAVVSTRYLRLIEYRLPRRRTLSVKAKSAFGIDSKRCVSVFYETWTNKHSHVDEELKLEVQLI